MKNKKFLIPYFILSIIFVLGIAWLTGKSMHEIGMGRHIHENSTVIYPVERYK